MSTLKATGSNKTRHAALMARLSKLEEEIESIKRELDKEDRTPIRKCPNEMLLHIFDYYLRNDSHHKSRHPLIRRLLLVCKQWNYLIMNTSSLWTRIEIRDPYDLFDYPSKRSLVPYITACVKRSKRLPLDVELDLEILPTTNQFIAQVIYDCDKRIPGGVYVDWDGLAFAIERVDLKLCGSIWHHLKLQDALDSLFGRESDSTILARFRTLELTLPLYPYYQLILSRLEVPFPHLISLKLLETGNNAIHAFTDLPATESLEFDNLSLSDFNVSPARLKNLSMGIHHYSSIQKLLPFNLLQILKLSFDRLADTSEQSPAIIHLPHLHTLSFVGLYDSLLGINFHLPSLDLFIIHAGGVQLKLPKLSPRRIMWYFDKAPYLPLESRDVMSLARDIIMLSPNTKHITILSSVREEIMAVLAEYGEKRADSTSIIDSKDGRSMIVEVVEKHELYKMMDIPFAWSYRIT